MKKHTLFIFSVLSSLSAAIITPTQSSVVTVVQQPQGDKELTWVDDQIQAILPSRVGISDGYINSLRDPMKMKKVAPVLTPGSKLLAPPKLGSTLDPTLKPKVVEEPLRLFAIINNSALINGKWYKVGQTVRAFTLTDIKTSSVLLSGKKDQKLILFLNKQNNNIKIITK